MDDHSRHEPPNDDSSGASNVVSLDAKRARTRAPKLNGELPECTGVQQMGVDPLLDNLRASCLSDATIDAARLFVLPSAKWRPYGFRSARPQSGLFIPFFEPGAATPFAYRLRPQHPLPAGKKGKLKKYDQPSGTGLLVYLPPLAATLEHLQDIQAPLIWTEGEKKALLLAQLGYCVVGLTGVDSWLDVDARARGDGRRLHPFIAQHYLIAGRQHVIVYDADARSKPSVMAAMQRLAGVLAHAGAASVHMCLPPEAGDAKGIDDYAHAHGIDAARNLLASVREPVEEIAPDLGCVPLSRFGATFDGSGAERLRLPRGYDVERDGSIWACDELEPDVKRLVLEAPMAITKQLADVYTGQLRTEVAFRDSRGHWRCVLVPRERLGDSRALVAELRPYGALVGAHNASGCARYLDAFERDNGTLIEQARCVANTGWHDGQFVLPDSVCPAGREPIQLEGNPEQLRMFSALRLAPGADAAQHLLALSTPMQASVDCTLAVYAALSAPLLALVRQSNFALHLCGDSSRGKTSMLRIAASVYGDPRHPMWVASWSSTGAALEQRAHMLCDLPQFYDEVGVADIEQSEQAVYMLVNGEGKQRSTKELRMRETLRWRTVVISTGERELADPNLTAPGAQVRVINLPIAGFGELDAHAIDAAVAACAAQHGALGRRWLEWLSALSEADQRGLLGMYAACERELRAVAAKSGDTFGGRIAGYFAVMMLVEQLTGQCWGLGDANGATVASAFESRMVTGEGRVQPLAERVLDTLRDWVLSTPASFPRTADVDELVRVCGYRREGGLVGFLRGPLVEHLRERGLPWSRALQRELRARGVLMTETSQRAIGVDTVRMTVGGRQVRVLALRLAHQPTDQMSPVMQPVSEITQ